MSKPKQPPRPGGKKIKPRKPQAVIHGNGLNYTAAAAKIAKGATPKNVARAAGSKARTDNGLRAVGARIIRQLKARGEVFDEFTRQGYGITRFAQQVIEQTEAMKVTRMSCAQEIHEYDDIDWAARAAARAQYMRAIGLDDLPPMVEADPEGMLGDLTNEDLARIAAQLGPAPGPPPGTGDA